jgi:hypothetical protein
MHDETEITVKQIKERLAQLGIEYDEKKVTKKSDLLDLLNSAVETPGNSEQNDEEASSETKSDVKDGSLTKASLKPSKRQNMDSHQVVLENMVTAEEKRDARNAQLLKQKGYNWYLCEARTVLANTRICRVGKYYVVHESDVQRVGTYKYRTGRFDKGVEVVEIRPRFRKQTPEQGIKEMGEQAEFDANDFVG